MISENIKGRLAWVDGLRAIAVLSVLCYHFEIELFSQGLLGVDMFFVISGFVVCKSLQENLIKSEGNFYLYISRFYKRRIWRLMPALLVMVGVTLLFCLLLPPAYLSSQIAFTGAAAIGGFANITLMLGSQTNYFDQMAEYNPFLHTWSLGVEEQFYILFPLLMWGLWRTRANDKLFVKALGTLSVISLGLSFWWSNNDTSVAFYSLFSRFWELAAGAIAFSATRSAKLDAAISDRTRSIVSWVALILLLTSLFQPASFASPLPAAILTVIASAVFMWANARPESQAKVLNTLISQEPVAYIGRISYSLYLWHWPAVVLLRWTVGFEGTLTFITAILLTFVLGIASYHLIELPTQSYAKRFKSVRPAIFVPLLVMIIGYVGSVIYIGYPRDFRFLMPSFSAVAAEGWVAGKLPTLQEQRASSPPDLDSTLLVVGDSHAVHLRGAAVLAAKGEGMGYRLFTDCAFTFQQPIANVERCAFLEAAQPGDVVLFSALNVPRFVDQDGSALPDPDPYSAHNKELREKAFLQFDEIVLELRNKGVGVVLRGPEPLFRYIPFRCADWYTKGNPICARSPEISREEILRRAKPVQAGFENTVASIDGVILLDVIEALCQAESCKVFDGSGNPLFFDQDHLTGWGNEAILPVLQEKLSAAREVLSAND